MIARLPIKPGQYFRVDRQLRVAFFYAGDDRNAGDFSDHLAVILLHHIAVVIIVQNDPSDGNVARC